MFPFEATVAGALFLIVRDEVDAQTAAMGVLAYLTGGYVFLHGMALRSDMISAALLMIALALASFRRPKLPVICCIALLTGLATLSTIKSVFYFPAIAVALWLKLDPRARRWGAVAASIGTAIGAGFVLASPILIERLFGVAVATPKPTIRSAGVRMFPGDLFSQARY